VRKNKSTKITQSAKGQECSLRIPGVCDFDNRTTVCAHINGAGTGYKEDDALTAYTCFSCHQWLDGGYVNIDLSDYTERDIKRAIRDSEQLRGIRETFPKLRQQGLIKT